MKPSPEAIEWRKKFIEACPPFVPEAQRQSYEILLDRYFQAAIDAATKELQHDVRRLAETLVEVTATLPSAESRPAQESAIDAAYIEGWYDHSKGICKVADPKSGGG